MNVRTRGLLVLAGSAAVGAAMYWFLFTVVADAATRTRVPALPFALPILGVVAGLVELVSGVPIRNVDQAWQKLPKYVQVPLGLLIMAGLLVAIVGGFAYVLTR